MKVVNKSWILTVFTEHRLRFKLREMACSEPWVDDQIRTIIRPARNGEMVACRFHNPHVFPPGGRSTGMRRCDGCGRWTPGPAVSLIERRFERTGPVVGTTQVCDDCRISQDVVRYAEVWAALPNLRPAGSKTVVGRGV